MMPKALKINDILDHVVRNTKLSIIRLKKVSKASYVLETNKGKFLLKVCPEWGSFNGWLSRFLVGSSIPFKTDIAVNRALVLRNPFKIFSAPALSDTDGKTYILLHYIPGKLGWDRHIVSVETLVSGLIEFQTSALEWSQTMVEKLGGALLEKPATRIFRGALAVNRSLVGYKAAWKALLVLWKCYRSQPRLDCFMILHNDLGFSNIVTGQDKRLHFIDFEDVIQERRWILCDIVDLSFNLDSFTFDPYLLSFYLNKLSIHFSGFKSVNFISQIRLALLRRALFGMMSRKLNMASKRRCGTFFCTVLIDDRAFSNWYKREFLPIIRKND